MKNADWETWRSSRRNSVSDLLRARCFGKLGFLLRSCWRSNFDKAMTGSKSSWMRWGESCHGTPSPNLLFSLPYKSHFRHLSPLYSDDSAGSSYRTVSSMQNGFIALFKWGRVNCVFYKNFWMARVLPSHYTCHCYFIRWCSVRVSHTYTLLFWLETTGKYPHEAQPPGYLQDIAGKGPSNNKQLHTNA